MIRRLVQCGGWSSRALLPRCWRRAKPLPKSHRRRLNRPTAAGLVPHTTPDCHNIAEPCDSFLPSVISFFCPCRTMRSRSSVCLRGYRTAYCRLPALLRAIRAVSVVLHRCVAGWMLLCGSLILRFLRERRSCNRSCGFLRHRR